jgi:iron complex transport system substrate-binding protein
MSRRHSPPCIALARILQAAILWAGAWAACAAATPQHSVPQRIASLNLCTDQLLLMLVPRARIASVTDWAARPESSYMAKAAAGIPVNYALAEGVLPQQPDLVIAGEYNDTGMLHLLRRLGYRVEIVQVPRNLTEARSFILQFGELVGAEANARRLVAQMDRQLADLAREVQAIETRDGADRPPLAAVYAPNGMTPGLDTVMTEILHRAGFRNLAAELGIERYGQLALERLLVAQPDVLVYEATAAAAGAGSIAHSYLQHPALQAQTANIPTTALPPPLSECVGPMTVEAIQRLVKMRAQWHPQRAAQHPSAPQQSWNTPTIAA